LTGGNCSVSVLFALLSVTGVTRAQQFSPAQVLAGQSPFCRAALAVDLDRDGDLDVLTTSTYGTTPESMVAWYENLDGRKLFGPRKAIFSGDAPIAMAVGDLDGDGDPDVVFASHSAPFQPSAVRWSENLGHDQFGAPELIWSGFATGTMSVQTADIDGDGDLDVAWSAADRLRVGSESEVTWHENENGLGDFGPPRIVTNDLASPREIRLADLDGDGAPDLIAASHDDDKITWFANPGGSGSFGPEQLISESADEAHSVFAADLDGDGDRDVLSASTTEGATLSWYRNTDGAGAFGAPLPLSSPSPIGYSSVVAVDLDGDGDLDAAAAGGGIKWHENTDGAGTFGPMQLVGQAVGDVRLSCGDLDGDGDQDLLVASGNYGFVSWYENLDGNGSSWDERALTTTMRGLRDVVAGDLDGDGDVDIAAAAPTEEKFAWYENLDGFGTFSSEHTISSEAEGVYALSIADMDGDGDADIVSAARLGSPALAWHRNQDGLGTFEPFLPVAWLPYPKKLTSVDTADLDGDGDQDVIWGDEGEGSLGWCLNEDGLGSFAPPVVIDSTANHVLKVLAADFTGNGAPDIAIGTSFVSRVSWHRNNLSGQGTFSSERVISTLLDYPIGLFAADLDADGDLDLLAASSDDHKVAWYPNDGVGLLKFGPQRLLSDTVPGARDVFAADVDEDGDLDVLAAGEDTNVLWSFENVDGAGEFGEQETASVVLNRAASVSAADVDGDGDLDLVAGSAAIPEQVSWHENRICCSLETDLDTLSIAAGGTQRHTLDAGVAKALEIYSVLSTTSESLLGSPLAPAPLRLPLGPSRLLSATLSQPDFLLSPSVGILDQTGRARTSLELPADLPAHLAGTVLRHAFLVFEPTRLEISGISHAATLTLAP